MSGVAVLAGRVGRMRARLSLEKVYTSDSCLETVAGVFCAIGISHRTRSLVRIAENWLLALPLVQRALRSRRRFLAGHVYMAGLVGGCDGKRGLKAVLRCMVGFLLR